MMAAVVGVAVVRSGRVLAARRAYPDDVAGSWEFPGGKVEPGEDPEATAVREVAEELGCTIAVTGWFTTQVSIRQDLVLRVAVAALVDGEPIPTAGQHDAVRWLRPGEVDQVRWLEADRPFVLEWLEGMAGVAD